MPYYYDVTIQPFFKSAQEPDYYNGTVVIQFICVNDASKFVIHKRFIDVFNSTLKIESQNDTAFNIMENFAYEYDDVTHFMTVDLENRMFKKGYAYTFSAQFKGYTKNDQVGFYKSSYVDSDNTKKYFSWH
jgi:hypothetical protein